ncbi:hypothetical protein [uncultured Bacteroides sp.]|uniref:hypothetical protein n=1 Tax=uncultured Bacteroides sp. TaxID=162156 RepID=UPI002AAA6F2B|nr:hypothetical protein [uncultured Bacteroides sp.]
MRKKYFLSRLAIFGLLTLGTTTTFVSCSKDYDGDIANLQTQITANTKAISDIQTLLNSGQWVKSVTAVTNGVTITLGNGTAYTITNGATGATGAAGATGATGKAGSVITIGTNGNWFIDGVDSGKTSKGATGATGAYYVPNADGYWHKIDGTTDTATTQKWLPEGTVTAIVQNGYVTLSNVSGITGGVVTLPMNNGALRSLVFVPQLYVDGVPAMNFSPFSYTPMTSDASEAGTAKSITPEVIAEYNLNPSGVAEGQIDKANLAFTYKNVDFVSTRSTEMSPTATFSSIANGILKVKVNAKSEYFEALGSSKIDVMALKVPLTDAAKAIESTAPDAITSDYATVYKVNQYQSQLAIASSKTVNPSLRTQAIDYHYPVTFADAQSGDADAQLVYNDQTGLDLPSLVKSCYGNHGSFDNDKYGLAFQFDMLGFDGTPLAYLVPNQPDGTDQEQFAHITANNKLVAKVFTVESQRYAAVDRTPIVRVKLVDTKNNNAVVKVAYIKVLIIKEAIDMTAIKADMPAFASFKQDCNVHDLNVTVQQMNEKVYNAAKLSKEDFHALYHILPSTGNGTVTEVANPGASTSNILTWTLQEDEIWNDADGAFAATVTYTANTAGSRPDVTINLLATVTRPTITIANSELIANYWDANLTYSKLNVAVPTLGDATSANCTFVNNLNAAFTTNADQSLKLNIPSDYTAYAGMTYQYFFKSQVNTRPFAGYAISVSDDGKALNATKGGVTKEVAHITDFVSNTGDLIAYAENDFAKEILNTNTFEATLFISGTVCEHAVAIGGKGTFLVKFIRPVNVASVAAKNFIDGVDFGATGSVLDILDVVKLTDWRNYSFADNANYYGYYGVTSITANTSGITCNIGGANATLPSTIIVAQVPPVDPTHYGTLTYKNNGTVVTSAFDMYVPVTVSYKWGSITQSVTVHVQPTVAQ